MPVFIIAEAGVNHNGSPERALEMIDVAAKAGANAVKFQTFVSELVVTRDAPKADYQLRTTDEGESQLEMERKLELDADAHRNLVARCEEMDIDFLSSPFDPPSVDLLARDLAVSRLKIASGEVTNSLLLLTSARTGLDIILSTGMCTLDDVEQALGVIAYGYLGPGAPPSRASFAEAFASKEGRSALTEKVTLLHATTEYPAPFEDVNLRAMDRLRETFGLPVGLSDHTPGITAPIAAAARGAAVVEKHFTLSRGLPGPDHTASIEPDELCAMVEGIRQVEKALGDGEKRPAASELHNMPIARRSLVAARPIRKGEAFTEENLTAKRPGTGISPMNYWDWLGREADRDYDVDRLIEP